MARFVFALERVLKYKEQRERVAEMRQMRALGCLRRSEAAAAALLSRLQQVAAELPGQATGGFALTAWLAYRRQVEHLAKELAVAQAQVLEAARLLQDASAALRQLAREAETLRQLRHRQHEQYLKRVAKTEQIILDEQGLRRWHNADAGALWDEERMP